MFPSPRGSKVSVVVAKSFDEADVSHVACTCFSAVILAQARWRELTRPIFFAPEADDDEPIGASGAAEYDFIC